MNFATIRHNSSYYGNCLSFLKAFILKKIHLHLEKNHFSYKKYVFWRHIIISKFQELHFPFLTLFNFKSFGGLNASFHMSYSLLEWVENWQIFIPSRLELLKTHQCAVHRTKYSFSHWIFYPPTGTTMPNHKQMENKFFNQPLNSRPGEVK